MAMMGLPIVTPDKYRDIANRYAAQDPADFLPDHYTTEQVEGYRHQQKVYVELMQSNNVVFNEMMLTLVIRPSPVFIKKQLSNMLIGA